MWLDSLALLGQPRASNGSARQRCERTMRRAIVRVDRPLGLGHCSMRFACRDSIRSPESAPSARASLPRLRAHGGAGPGPYLAVDPAAMWGISAREIVCVLTACALAVSLPLGKKLSRWSNHRLRATESFAAGASLAYVIVDLMVELTAVGGTYVHSRSRSDRRRSVALRGRARGRHLVVPGGRACSEGAPSSRSLPRLRLSTDRLQRLRRRRPGARSGVRGPPHPLRAPDPAALHGRREPHQSRVREPALRLPAHATGRRAGPRRHGVDLPAAPQDDSVHGPRPRRREHLRTSHPDRAPLARSGPHRPFPPGRRHLRVDDRGAMGEWGRCSLTAAASGASCSTLSAWADVSSYAFAPRRAPRTHRSALLPSLSLHSLLSIQVRRAPRRAPCRRIRADSPRGMPPRPWPERRWRDHAVPRPEASFDPLKPRRPRRSGRDQVRVCGLDARLPGATRRRLLAASLSIPRGGVGGEQCPAHIVFRSG